MSEKLQRTLNAGVRQWVWSEKSNATHATEKDKEGKLIPVTFRAEVTMKDAQYLQVRDGLADKELSRMVDTKVRGLKSKPVNVKFTYEDLTARVERTMEDKVNDLNAEDLTKLSAMIDKRKAELAKTK